MDERLRRSAAHVLVGDIAAPGIDEPTRHHLVRVLRLRDGASVTATDGRGAWRACTLRGGAIAKLTLMIGSPALNGPVCRSGTRMHRKRELCHAVHACGRRHAGDGHRPSARVHEKLRAPSRFCPSSGSNSR